LDIILFHQFEIYVHEQIQELKSALKLAATALDANKKITTLKVKVI